MSVIAITDYFDAPSAEEQAILGDLIGTDVATDTEILLVWHAEIDDTYISGLPRLRGVQRYGVGHENLHLDSLKSKGIVCCNSPDYGVDEVADTAVAMIMNITRGISLYNDLAKTLKHDWQENVIRGIRRSSELTVGVVGAGRIGSSVLLRCRQLGYKTCFYDPYLARGYEKIIHADRFDHLHQLLAAADVVSLHAPLNAETMGMVDGDFIARMRPGSSLVNTARGRLVADLDILYTALATNHLSQVALDVLPDEPPRQCQLIAAWRDAANPMQSRIMINPHTAYFSEESYLEIRSKAALNAQRLYHREEPFNRL